MTELCRLARKYGTDKTYYTPFYSMLLEARRDTTLRVLEIGIGTTAAMSHVKDYEPGASLRMWEEYFPNATVCGADIDASVIINKGRIRSFQVNQNIPAQFGRVIDYGPFDLIVDDGSHNVLDQLITSDTLLPYLAPGGLYIIEDVNGDELSRLIARPHTDVFVKGGLTGHCVVINA